MPPPARRRTEGFNLTFLDVMACGLGAVILLFLIIRHNTDTGAPEDQRLRSELQALRERESALEERIGEARRRGAELDRSAGAREEERAATRSALDSLHREAERLQGRNEALRASVEEAGPAQSSAVVEDPAAGEEQYLLGLRVEGERIAILLDRSASMTDEKLIDVVRRKVLADPEKRKGPKWRRTRRTVRWLLNRLPGGSKVAVVAFNEKAAFLGGGGWQDGRDRAAVSGLFLALDDLVPTGATNLQAGLDALARLEPPPTDLYLVTDGLPTRSEYKGSLLSGCSHRSRNVSGECRKALLGRTLRESARHAGRGRVNVILLPLEGDPEAAAEYWAWSSATGGLLMAPAAGWP